MEVRLIIEIGMELYKTKKYCFFCICFVLKTFLIGCAPHHIDIQPDLPAILKTPKKVVLLLPLRGPWKEIGEAVKTGFNTANEEAGFPLEIAILETESKRSIRSLYLQAIKQKADLIIGPLLKEEVKTLAQFSKMKTPVLTLNYLDSTVEPPANFYQFGLSPQDEAKQAIIHAKQASHKAALVIAPDTPWGKEITQTFIKEWEAVGGTLVDQLNYTPSFASLSNQIQNFLQFQPPQQRRTDFDVIFLAATPELARQINPLLAFYFASNVPIYSTAAVYDSEVLPYLNRDLDPIIFCDAPWQLGIYNIKPHIKKKIAQRQSTSFQQYARYYALGVDAFQLAMQLDKLDSNEITVIQGPSGTLFLNQDRYILRQLPCAKFKRGIPKIYYPNLNHQDVTTLR